MENMIRISIEKEKQTFVGNPAIEIFLDASKVGEVKSGEIYTVNTVAGFHTLEFKYSFRSEFIKADFQQNSNVCVRFDRVSGDIKAELLGAEIEQPFYNSMENTRDDKKVYPDKRKTSPLGSLLLSVLIVGLGQMINGQLIKGLIMLLGGIVIGAITGGIGAPIIWILSSIDAYICTNKLKQGKPIGKFSFF